MMSEIWIKESQHGNIEMNISEQVKQVFFEHLQGKKTDHHLNTSWNTLHEAFFLPLI